MKEISEPESRDLVISNDPELSVKFAHELMLDSHNEHEQIIDFAKEDTIVTINVESTADIINISDVLENNKIDTLFESDVNHFVTIEPVMDNNIIDMPISIEQHDLTVHEDVAYF